MKILVFVDADPVVRHFIHSGQLVPLEREHDVAYVFNDERDVPYEQRRMFTDFDALGLPRVLATKVDRHRHGLWYTLTTTTVLRNHRDTPNYAARRRLAVAISSERFTRRCELLGRSVIYPIFKWLYLKAMGLHPGVVQILETEKPDLIVHPSLLNGPFQNELALAAEKLDIPLVVLMNSWDNPTAKSTSIGRMDHLVVWGEQTREHSATYLRVPRERIHCFGAAQFQVYRNPPSESREELAYLFGVPAQKRIILYAGAGPSGAETDYLADLDAAVENGQLVNCHILYRPHPWRGSLVGGERDFFSVGFRHVTMDPHMKDFYVQRVRDERKEMFLADYAVTNKLLSLVEIVASPLSTLLLEALINLKPAVMLMPQGREGEHMHTDQIHFRAFAEMDGVVRCGLGDSVSDACITAMEWCEDPEVCERLRRQVGQLAIMDGPTYGERLLDLVTQIGWERNVRAAGVATSGSSRAIGATRRHER